MLARLEQVELDREAAREAILDDKQKVIKKYNMCELRNSQSVWKATLPLGHKDPEYGKWSPNWQGPFRIHQSLGRGVYRLEDLNGEVAKKTTNASFIKGRNLGLLRQKCTRTNSVHCIRQAPKELAVCTSGIGDIVNADADNKMIILLKLVIVGHMIQIDRKEQQQTRGYCQQTDGEKATKCPKEKIQNVKSSTVFFQLQEISLSYISSISRKKLLPFQLKGSLEHFSLENTLLQLSV